MANNGLSSPVASTSAPPPRADIHWPKSAFWAKYVRFTPNSRPSWWCRRFSDSDPLRTLSIIVLKAKHGTGVWRGSAGIVIAC